VFTPHLLRKEKTLPGRNLIPNIVFVPRQTADAYVCVSGNVRVGEDQVRKVARSTLSDFLRQSALVRRLHGEKRGSLASPPRENATDTSQGKEASPLTRHAGFKLFP